MSPTEEALLHARWAAEDEQGAAMFRPAQYAEQQRLASMEENRQRRLAQRTQEPNRWAPYLMQ